MKGKLCSLNLYSDGKDEFEFAFSDDENKLPNKRKMMKEMKRKNYGTLCPYYIKSFPVIGWARIQYQQKLLSVQTLMIQKRFESVQNNIEKFYLSVFEKEWYGD